MIENLSMERMRHYFENQVVDAILFLVIDLPLRIIMFNVESRKLQLLIPGKISVKYKTT